MLEKKAKTIVFSLLVITISILIPKFGTAQSANPACDAILAGCVGSNPHEQGTGEWFGFMQGCNASYWICRDIIPT